MILSTGMATRQDIETAVSFFREKGLPLALLQCTSAYPCSLEDVGLNVIEDLRHDYGCPVGLSDHSGSVFPGLAALARGANILEVHVTFHRRMFGPDVRASVTFDDLRMLCAMRDALTTMDAFKVDKDKMIERMQPLRDIFGRSLAPLRPIPAGAVLSRDMLTLKKPAGGIPPEAAVDIFGRRLAKDVTPDRILRWSDLAEEDT
jgi:N-acetylneuraminate synthase